MYVGTMELETGYNSMLSESPTIYRFGKGIAITKVTFIFEPHYYFLNNFKCVKINLRLLFSNFATVAMIWVAVYWKNIRLPTISESPTKCWHSVLLDQSLAIRR